MPVLLLGVILLIAYLVLPWFDRPDAADPAAPSTSAANPGVAVAGKVTLKNSEKSWAEPFNVVELAAQVLAKRGFPVTAHDTWLEHPDSGLVFQPRLVNAEARDGGGVSTITTIETSHPGLVPEGVFEYQHSAGDNLNDAIREGFEQWVQLDLPVLLDALRQKPEACMALEMRFPATQGTPERVRRILLGPVGHFAAQPAPKTDADTATQEEHPFCSCCLFTHTMDAFKPLVESDKFCAIRFYAARDPNGVPQADCRVNGRDWEEGAQALRDYVQTWPQRGFEFRKQYVVLQNFEKHREGAEAEKQPQ